ncbi:probable protein, unknown function [Plasmodium sp. gorilla clade G2]|uniref:probable protein, unknown function n=1 Tax=Plasmodium sp. gorilla clade G2 TaxID=880535 RepID=UPI000D2B3A56|nr:probable protein, unknown function [Plasmodium sp. gorilla clade G2]SOV20193.1 probable protein, unknown function [Plasmodium sp. gorilla clade G2]
MNKIWNITFCLLFHYLCIIKNNVSTNDITKEDKHNLRHRLGIDNFNIKAENNTCERENGKKGSEASEKETKEKNSSNSDESSINDNDNTLPSEEQMDTNLDIRDKTHNEKLNESSITKERTEENNSYDDDDNIIECRYPEELVGEKENRQNSFDLRSNTLLRDILITPKCDNPHSDYSNHDGIIEKHETSKITSLNAPPSSKCDKKDVSIDAVSEDEDPSESSSDSLQVDNNNSTHLDGHESNSGSLQLTYEGHHDGNDGNDGVHGATEDRKKARPDKIKELNQECVECLHDITMDKVERPEKNAESDDGDETDEVTYDENDDSSFANKAEHETNDNHDYSLSTIYILNGHSDEKKSNMKNIGLNNFKDISIPTMEEEKSVSKMEDVKEEENNYYKYKKNILKGTKKESGKVYDLYDYILDWVFGPMKITETNISKENDSLELKQKKSWDGTNIFSENENLNEDTEEDDDEEEDINYVEQLNEIQGEIPEDEDEEENEENIEEEEDLDHHKMLNESKIHDIEKKNKNVEKNIIRKDIKTTKYTVMHLEKYNNIKKEAENFFKTIIYLFSDNNL